MLGLMFNTEMGTWSLPKEKIISLLKLLQRTIASEVLSLNEVEVLFGKLAHFKQHAPALSLLLSEIRTFLRALLEAAEISERSMVKMKVPEYLKHDLRTILAIVRHTMDAPLPIVHASSKPAVDALRAWTDASGHLLASPSIGVYIPSELGEQPVVASLAFPRQFMLSKDTKESIAFNKTTTLECLGVLAALSLDPLRFAEREALFHMDNIASVYAFQRGYSKKDEWATTIVRAARIVAAGIRCTLHFEWERGRTSRESIITDDLTNNLIGGLNDVELEAYMARGDISFPDPILHWMANPGTDLTLGSRTLSWLNNKFVALQVLYGKVE